MGRALLDSFGADRQFDNEAGAQAGDRVLQAESTQDTEW